jgi:hypothetical protein
MKAYVELPCDQIDTISKKIYAFLETIPGLLETREYGWHFVDLNRVLKSVPELLDFFKQYKLIPRHAAVTIIKENDHLPKHTDELPVVAKMNLPVCNTTGWANRWYENNQLVAELFDIKQPIIFNSQIEHSVEKITDTSLPRIVASFTFHNEPIEMLQ